MSKTIRRKKVTDSEILNEICYGYKDGFKNCMGMTCGSNCPVRNNKKTISVYHRDTKKGYGLSGHAPKDFNKMINRIKRAKMKAEVKRIYTQGDYDDYSFDKWVHDAGWLYW